MMFQNVVTNVFQWRILNDSEGGGQFIEKGANKPCYKPTAPSCPPPRSASDVFKVEHKVAVESILFISNFLILCATFCSILISLVTKF